MKPYIQVGKLMQKIYFINIKSSNGYPESVKDAEELKQLIKSQSD
jgi:hypothetical protein